MFRQSLLVLSFAILHVAYGLNCFQCEEMNLLTLKVDETCKYPVSGETTEVECNENQVCVTHNIVVMKLGRVETPGGVSRFCGVKADCKVKDNTLKQQLQVIKNQLQQLEALQQQQQTQNIQQVLQSAIERSGECSVCDDDLCNG